MTARERELETENARLREANRRLQASGEALERDKLIAELRTQLAESEAAREAYVRTLDAIGLAFFNSGLFHGSYSFKREHVVKSITELLDMAYCKIKDLTRELGKMRVTLSQIAEIAWDCYDDIPADADIVERIKELRAQIDEAESRAAKWRDWAAGQPCEFAPVANTRSTLASCAICGYSLGQHLDGTYTDRHGADKPHAFKQRPNCGTCPPCEARGAMMGMPETREAMTTRRKAIEEAAAIADEEARKWRAAQAQESNRAGLGAATLAMRYSDRAEVAETIARRIRELK